ncbi:hypothetical protein ABIE37_000340 [Arthrobacter bambusae]|uniref:Uncharacterized protein n=1 Tax=Arthrobacter bambusae TaxID=1338426 RepID=A0ABV2P1F2_9MICC
MTASALLHERVSLALLQKDVLLSLSQLVGERKVAETGFGVGGVYSRAGFSVGVCERDDRRDAGIPCVFPEFVDEAAKLLSKLRLSRARRFGGDLHRDSEETRVSRDIQINLRRGWKLSALTATASGNPLRRIVATMPAPTFPASAENQSVITAIGPPFPESLRTDT